jgi:hypothetical protein
MAAMNSGADPINVLGISAYYHDSAAVLLRNSEIIAAVQEERYPRKKHDARIELKQLDNFDPTKLPALEEGYRAVAKLASLAAEIRRSGKQVVVMLSPSELQVTPGKQADVARSKGIELETLDFELPAYLVQEIFTTIDPKIPVMHLHDAFVCASNAGEDLHYGTDTHWTAEGNQLAGEILAQFIASQWLDQAILVNAEDPCVVAGDAPEVTNSRRAALESLGLPITPFSVHRKQYQGL